MSDIPTSTPPAGPAAASTSASTPASTPASTSSAAASVPTATLKNRLQTDLTAAIRGREERRRPRCDRGRGGRVGVRRLTVDGLPAG